MGEKISFVIPCYRSEGVVPDVVHRLEELYGRGGRAYEIILVNDASPDGTLDAIRKLAEENPNVKGINLSRNFGQHAAIMAGLREVSGDMVVLMDDDGQTPPAEARKLIAQVDAGHDVAIARYPEKKHSFLRNLGSKFNNFMAHVMIGKPKQLYLSSFVAMKRYVANQICAYTFPYPYISGMLIRATGDIVNVDVDHLPRETGASGYTMRKLLSLWFNGFTNFSIKPLRMAIVLGVVIAILGVAYAVYALVVKIMGLDIPVGWASQVSITAVIGGIVLIVLGMAGEYIGRIYMGLNQQPQYVVKERLNIQPHDEEE